MNTGPRPLIRMGNALFLFVLLSGFALGCDANTAEPASKSHVFAEVEETRARPARVITLGGPITEIAFALGAGDQVVAVDRSSLYPPEALEREMLDYYRHVSVEGILAQRPELVISTEGMGPDGAIEQLRSAGVEVVILDDAVTLEQARARVEKMGSLLGADEQVPAVLASLEEDLAAAKKVVASIEEVPRVLFLYARGQGMLMVGGVDTPATAVIELAGGKNAVDFTGFRPLSAEGVIAARPDVVVVTDNGLESLGGAEGLWALPGIKESSAGQAGRYVAIEDLKLLGFGPRLGQAVHELASAFAGQE